MKHYSLNFEQLSNASRAMYEKAHELRCMDVDERGRVIVTPGLSPCDIAIFLDEMRAIIEATDYDTMLVEDEEGDLTRTTDQYFEP